MKQTEITEEECKRIIEVEGGLEALTVFGCYTYPEGSIKANGQIAKEKDIYTEWGRKGDDAPLITIHTQGDITKYYKFERQVGN